VRAVRSAVRSWTSRAFYRAFYRAFLDQPCVLPCVPTVRFVPCVPYFLPTWAVLRRYLEQCNALWTQRQPDQPPKFITPFPYEVLRLTALDPALPPALTLDTVTGPS
jgi:hypothetical protein